MPVCFVIAPDWKLRASLRAELRERGIDALGIETADDAGHLIAQGQVPFAAVIEARSELVGDPAIQKLIERVPAILIASRTESVPLPAVDTVLYRPVRIQEIVVRVDQLRRQGHAV